MKIDVYKIDGTLTNEQIEVSDEIFGIEPNNHVIYLAVKAQLAHKRQGTSKAKERSEVSGGGKKPWKQKGRGTARSGSSRSPLWVGGGTIFGPKPRTYKMKVNRKVMLLAKKSAYSHKMKSNQIIVVEDFNFESPKTKEFAKIMQALKLEGKKTLVLTNGNRDIVYKSGRNIDKVQILEALNASTFDLLNNQMIVLQKGAVEQINNILN